MTDPIYVVHGYCANPEANWFPWLKQLGATQLHRPVHVVTLPEPDNPRLADWLAACQSQIPQTDGVTLIGHSLGCITTLRFLAQANVQNVNLILVSGFDDLVPGLTELAPFTAEALDYVAIRAKLKAAVVISARDDHIVPYQFTQRLPDNLAVPFTLLPTGDHLITETGGDRLPLLEFLLKNGLSIN